MKKNKIQLPVQFRTLFETYYFPLFSIASYFQKYAVLFKITFSKNYSLDRNKTDKIRPNSKFSKLNIYSYQWLHKNCIINTHLERCGWVNTCLDWDLLFSSPEAGGSDDLSASLCSQPGGTSFPCITTFTYLRICI